MTSELRRQMRKRDRLFRQAQRAQQTKGSIHGCSEAESTAQWEKWRRQRNFVTQLNKCLRNNHIQKTARTLIEHQQDPYRYHQTLKSLIGGNQHREIPALETTNGDLVTNETDKADILNKYFASQTDLNTQSLKLPDDYVEDRNTPTLQQIIVTKEQVLKALNSLKVRKSTGPDQIPTKLLKLTALLIHEPLTELFNKSLAAGIFPDSWKKAYVTPIFKNSGSPSDFRQYRPISLLSCLSKILEKLVFSAVYSHITENQLLSDRQSGYRSGHSTQLQLMYLTHKLYKELDEGRDMTAVFLDISKYFDKIWHDGLLHKCKNDFLLSGTILQWLGSYLTDRTQQVRVGDAFSTAETIRAGCPQGSVLGPLLALMYLDGLTDKVTNEILFYADDTSLYASHTTADIDTVQKSLQRDLDTIEEYARQWAIKFNSSKTTQMTFSHKPHCQTPVLRFSGEIISSEADTHKHLGITFSKDLRFHKHVNNIIKKANIALSPLYPIAKHLHRTTLSHIYSTYVRPHFDYCDIVFDGHITLQDEMRLEKVQSRAAKLVTGAPFRTSTEKLRHDLGWETLKTRRTIHKQLFFHRLTNTKNQQPGYIREILPELRFQNTGRTLRNSRTLTLPANKTTSFQRSFIPNATRTWNRLPEALRAQNSLSQFKKGIIGTFGTPNPPAYFSFGSKLGNSYHTQIRTGSLQLNSRLYLTQTLCSPRCLCGHKSETVQHFIFHCPLVEF